MKPPEMFPEDSAQGTWFKPNPLVQPVLRKLFRERKLHTSHKVKLVDLGCGKLRHLGICRKYADRVVLVDTERQIERTQKFGDAICTMRQYVQSLDHRDRLVVQTIDEFERQQHNADIVLSVAVMDAVLKKARRRIVRAAFRNLRTGGYFVVIVPRNDSSILVRCKVGNRFEDGFIFKRGHNKQTFYANFRDTFSLLGMFRASGFELLVDLSVFRQVCLILQKP